MNDPNLNQLLKWSVRNSEKARNDPTSQSDPKAERDPERGLNAEALSQLMGGPTDADRMRHAMTAILSDEVDLDNKMIAFDNFEQLVENIDNANNMENLGLWVPLVQLLDSPEPKLRMMAAWCIGTAVQNNPRGQERLLAMSALPRVVKMAIHDSDPSARKKAVRVLSSESRNYQVGLDAILKELPQEYHPEGKVDTSDMEAVDAVMDRLRSSASGEAD